MEANVRYLPLCQLKGFEKNIYNIKQQSYDPYEWDFNSWNDFRKIKPRQSWYDREANRRIIHELGYRKSEECESCSARQVCDGFHDQYVKRFGFGEEKPYSSKQTIKNPAYFIQNQIRTRELYQKPDKTILKYLFSEDKELLSNLAKSTECIKFADRKIGQLGLFLKKHWPKLYLKLKNRMKWTQRKTKNIYW